jgi:hypothetical protein
VRTLHRELGWTICQRPERPRALVIKVMVSRASVRGGLGSSVASLRVDASAMYGFRVGAVSTCRDTEAAGGRTANCDADQDVCRLLYALRAFTCTLYVAYCYVSSQRSDTFELADVVFRAERETCLACHMAK